MTHKESLFSDVEGSDAFKELIALSEGSKSIRLDSLVGSAYSIYASGYILKTGGIHVFIAQDKDSAAYLCNDLYNILDANSVFFFPTGYKRSIQYGQQEPSGIVQRTAALNALRVLTDNYLVICTYPEAISEMVVQRDEMESKSIKVSLGESVSIEILESLLTDNGFERVDFVSEPGQYSIRGGIFDVFSFAQNRPYRLDFFGDTIDSIRLFDTSNQLSIEKLESAEIIPNFKDRKVGEKRQSFASFTGSATYWVADMEYTLKKLNDIRSKVLSELEEPSLISTITTSRKEFLKDTEQYKFMMLVDNAKERVADCRVDFHTSPQPSFNKNFELLSKNISQAFEQGYTTYILSDNKAQIERLENIFQSIGGNSIKFKHLNITLHNGFVSNQLKANYYTDHQIFERYHRYKIRNELQISERLTVSELNSLKVGDYVVHIDHGVGRFGGIVRMAENGKNFEMIKLIYRDNDVLFVNVHALHRISRYKDKDSAAPKIYKLGSGAWQRLKTNAKTSLKDIARELITLYAKRKASRGFAFSADSYLQNELEASFKYEDTPDQQSATKAVKVDMESIQPMDRLVCGDVGFGKTEIAIRAAFKAVCDSKQVAILVPTTILALQHYRTFSRRLADFPVRVEQLSRSKTAKEAKEILADLESGKIDILIGTHKILGKTVKYKDLGLLIIDEEQKFGVGHKEKLRQMSVSIDTLTLTATPIPRTLQFSLMGSRDLSIISTPPPNRRPITTESHLWGKEIIKEIIDAEVARFGQVFFVNNNIEKLPGISAMIKEVCPNVRIAIAHGQMPPQDLEQIIMDFIFGEFDVLIATTIIENGIDIPNANTIIINDAQNFGLSDLHQMRGRVGRGDRKGFCYLLTPPDEMLSGEARRRIKALEDFSDLGAGFNIAMQDLDIRGAGNLLGAQQSGFIADIGFETYQKILNEAMDELRSEGVVGDNEQEQQILDKDIVFVRDCHIETDIEAYIPDSYVEQSAEKIKLYKQLDSLTKDEELDLFRQNLEDRFGTVPEEVKALFNIIRLRSICAELGFEKAKVKNGLMILTFVDNQQSPYYKSDIFHNILRYIATNPKKFVLKNNNKLSLLVREIRDIAQGIDTLHNFIEK